MRMRLEVFFVFISWTSKLLVASTGGGGVYCQGMGNSVSECVNVDLGYTIV